jgi:hypothetical protein
MPNGTSLVLERIKDGRRVRSDTVIHRRTLPPPADDDINLSEAFDALQAVMITDIQARRQRLSLYAPGGSYVDGHTLMKNIRNLPSLPAEDDEMQVEDVEIEVDALATSLWDDLDLAEDASSMPEVVLRGYVRALRRKFSASEIAAAADAERGDGP